MATRILIQCSVEVKSDEVFVRRIDLVRDTNLSFPPKHHQQHQQKKHSPGVVMPYLLHRPLLHTPVRDRGCFFPSMYFSVLHGTGVGGGGNSSYCTGRHHKI